MQAEFSVDSLKFNLSFLPICVFLKDFFISWIVNFLMSMVYTFFYNKALLLCSLMAQEGFSEDILAKDLQTRN